MLRELIAENMTPEMIVAMSYLDTALHGKPLEHISDAARYFRTQVQEGDGSEAKNI